MKHLYRVIEYVDMDPELQKTGKIGRRLFMMKPSGHNGEAKFVAPVRFPIPQGGDVPIQVPIKGAKTVQDAFTKYEECISEAGKQFYRNIERNLEDKKMTADGFVVTRDEKFKDGKPFDELITAVPDDTHCHVLHVLDEDGNEEIIIVNTTTELTDELKSKKIIEIRDYEKTKSAEGSDSGVPVLVEGNDDIDVAKDTPNDNDQSTEPTDEAEPKKVIDISDYAVEEEEGKDESR